MTLWLFTHASSSDSPRLHAFCRVAFSVRLSVLAISMAGLFRFASDFNFRICPDVQIVLLEGLFIAKQSPEKKLTADVQNFLVDDPSLFDGCVILVTPFF